LNADHPKKGVLFACRFTQYGIAAGRGVFNELHRHNATAERREQSARHPGV
jgi:hypothetical protein